MAHATSNKAAIWRVFFILTVITLVEVVLGIYKPDSLFLTQVLGTSPLNWIFLILTLVKAYYIAWEFMHLSGEKTWFRRSIVWTGIFLILYLTFYLLTEGSAIRESFTKILN